LFLFLYKFCGRSALFNRYDDAIAPHHSHLCALAYLTTIGRNGFPVVAVNGHTAVSVGCNGFTHSALLTYQCVGIALAVGVVAMKIFQHDGTHKEQTEHREYREDEQLPKEWQSGERQYRNYSCRNGEADYEKIATREFKNEQHESHYSPELPQILSEIVEYSHYRFILFCYSLML